MNPLLSSKDKFLGTLMPSLGTKTTTASTTGTTGLTSPVMSASPSATPPIVPTAPAKTPAATTPKSQFVSSVAQSPVAPITPAAPQQPASQAVTGNVTTPSGAVVNSSTGGLVSGPPVNQNQRYTDAYEAYIRTLTPSQEESDATNFLNSLTLQQKKDQEEALGRGETIGFAAGEAARVNKNNAFQIEAATNAVNALTGRRTSASEAAKARMDFEKSLMKDTPEDAKGFSLSPGEDRYEYDPVTKQYTKVASGAPRQTSEPKISATEKKDRAYGDLNALLTPGETLPDGTPILDQNGYLNPTAFKTLLAAARQDGISRKEFIEQYSHLLFEGDGQGDEGQYQKSYTYPGYGLSLAEIEKLAGL